MGGHCHLVDILNVNVGLSLVVVDVEMTMSSLCTIWELAFPTEQLLCMVK